MIRVLAIALLLSGCGAFETKEQPVAVQTKYVITTIPAEMLTVPPPTYKIDPATATDKDAAHWMTDSEARYLEIEKKLQAVKKYQDGKLNDLMNNKSIKPEDVIKN